MLKYCNPAFPYVFHFPAWTTTPIVLLPFFPRLFGRPRSSPQDSSSHGFTCRRTITIMLRPANFLAPLRVTHPRAPRTRWTRLFSTTPVSRSALFNLGGLAASRESQYLSKETGIPRTEYSANIHLIRSSEVDPFAPAPGATKQAKETRERIAQKKRLDHHTLTSKGVQYKTDEVMRRQSSETLQNKQISGEASHHGPGWAPLQGAAGAIFLAMLLVLAYQNWTVSMKVEQLISKLEQEALARENREALPEAPPAVLPADTRQNAEVLSHEQPSEGVMHWLRSSFWASSGR